MACSNESTRRITAGQDHSWDTNRPTKGNQEVTAVLLLF